MPIKVVCPSCSASLTAPDELAGTRVKCGRCMVSIPVSLPTVPPPPAIRLRPVADPSTAPPVRRKARTDPADIPPPRKRGRKPKAKLWPKVLLIVGFGVGLMLLGIVVAGYLILDRAGVVDALTPRTMTRPASPAPGWARFTCPQTGTSFDHPAVPGGPAKEPDNGSDDLHTKRRAFDKYIATSSGKTCKIYVIVYDQPLISGAGSVSGDGESVVVNGVQGNLTTERRPDGTYRSFLVLRTGQTLVMAHFLGARSPADADAQAFLSSIVIR